MRDNPVFQFLKRNALPITVFITGACVLVVEIVATRILSPFFGNTIFTVSSVISVILGALSIGYYVGGRLSDRHPSMHWFFAIILLSGLILLLFHVIGTVTLPMFGYTFPLSTGPLFFSVMLFFPPALLLGALSPYAVKLQNIRFPSQGVGSIAGNMFFWSTLGSITGSLMAGFVLIPSFGIDQIIIATGLTLFFLGLVPLMVLGKKKYIYRSFFTLVVLIVTWSYVVVPVATGTVVYEKDAIYEKIVVFDDEYEGRPARFFQQDRSNSGAMFLDSDDPRDLVYDYTKYYAIYDVFNPEVKNALVIGGGAYSIPKALLADLPSATVDVSEIEPSLYDLAKTYFGLSHDPRLHNYTDDGRRFLHDSEKNYDLIFSDVYYSLFSIPTHFTTKEFFEIAKQKLNQEGVFIANMIGDLSRQEPSLIFAEMRTFQTVFPNSYFFAVRSPKSTHAQNIMFVGYNSDNVVDLTTTAIKKDPNPVISTLSDKLIDIKRFDLSSQSLLTDNYAPVEYLTGRVLQRNLTQEIFDGREMLAIIEKQLRYGPRYPTASGHAQIQHFLIAEMKTLAPEVTAQTWKHSEANGQSYQLTNIIGRLYPEKTRRIILGTHYDSQKISFNNSSNQDQPSPGANNSASGVAVLTEVARLLSENPEEPTVGVDIVFFDGEEGEESQGGDFTNWKPLGSEYFVEHLEELYGKEKPVSGLIVDMVCDKDLRIPKEASSLRDAPTETAAFWNVAQKVDEAVFQNDIQQEIQDDHTPLNRVGIPSVLVIDYEYPPYATTGDTIDKCSGKSLETVAEAVFKYIYSRR